MEYKDQDSLNSGATTNDDLLPSSVSDVHMAPAEGVSGTSLQGRVSNTPASQREWADVLSGNFWKITTVLCLMVVILGGILWIQSRRNEDKAQDQGVAQRFNDTQISLDEILEGKDLTLDDPSGVTINGPLHLGSDLSLTPSLQPTGAKRGQLYFDQGTNELAYYNGNNFVFLTGPTAANGGVQSLGGATGQVALGTGLDSSAGQINNSGVLSVQGQNGDVTFTAGAGMAINGTTFSNGGVIGVTSGSSNVTVTDDGNGNVSISVDNPIAGTGTVTSSGGNAGTIPLFTASQNIEDSIITQSGLNVTIAGSLNLGNALTVGNGGTGTASLASNGILVGNGTAAITSVAAGGAGLCLLSTAGAPAWSACPSGGGGGVTSLNGQVGGLNIANASAAGSTITIDDATTSTKGIASFNSTNFSVTGGAVNTAQNIDATATPTFAGVNTNNITPSAALTVGVSAQTALLQGSTTTITSNGAGNNIVLNSAATIELQDNTNVTGNVTTTGDLAVNGGDITSTGALNITPGGALTIGASSQALTLQGGATSSFRATSGANTTVVAFTSPTANTTLNFPALSAGTYTICTTSGNCSGAAATLQSVYDNSTNPEIVLDATRGAMTIRDNASALGANLLEVQNNAGSTTYLAVTASGISVTGTAVVSGAISGTTLTGSGNINSTGGALQTNGTSRIDNSGNLINIVAVTASGSATFQGGSATLGTNSQAGSVVLNDGSSNTGTLQVAALGQNTVYTLPDPGAGSATICLTTGNCAGSGTGVTTTGGTTNRLSKFSGSQALTDSSISDDGTTVTTTGNLIVQGGVGTIGVAGVQGGTLRLAYGGGAFTGIVATDTLTADQNYLLPNASGTFCLTSGNCAGVGGTGDVLQGGNNFGTALTLGTNDAFAFNFETGGTTRMTIAADGSQLLLSSNMDLVLQGATAYITNSQGQTSSEALGQGATVNGANAVAVGNGATSPASGVSVGHNAGASAGDFGGPVSIGDGANGGSWGVAVGQSSSTSGNNSVAIGNGALAAQDAVALGMGTNAMLNGVALGYGAVTGGNSRIVIGHNATATADFQLVIGSDDTPVADAYIGNGVSSATPQATSLHATGGSGTDVAGADFNLAAGAGTGSAAGGNLNFQVATPGTSGSSANVPATVFSLNGSNGSAVFKNLANSAAGFQVQNAGGAAAFTLDTTTSNALLAGDLAVNGGDITSAGALNITPGGTLTVGTSSQTLTLQGGAASSFRATNGANTTVVSFISPTANTTLNFPALAAGTYAICTSSGNCAGAGTTLQSAYTNSSTPEITLDATRLGLTIRDNSTPVGGNLLEVQNNTGSTTYLAVTASGAAVTGTIAATSNINTSGGTLQTNGTSRIDNSGNIVNIGNITGTGAITVASSGAGNDVTIDGADQFIVQDGSVFNALSTFNANISLGTNDLVGTTADIDLTNFDVVGSTGNVTAGTYNGQTISSAASFTGTLSSVGNINTTGGTLQTNSTNRIDNSGNLVNVGNITGTGAITIASSGAGNDVIIDGADQFIVQDAAQFNAQASFDVGTNGEVNIGGTGTGTNTRDYLIVTMTNNTTSGVQRGMLIQNAAGTGASEGFIALDNADTDTSVGYGLQITSSVAGITTALDVSDADIVTALSFGANDLVGTTGNIDMTNFDVTGSTGAVTAGTYNGQTISSTANFTGTLGVAGNTTLTGDIAVNGGDITSTGALNITPGGALTVGATGQALTLQGSASTQLTATGGGFTTALGFTGTPAGAVTYNFDRSAAAGTYNVCTSVGNCAASGYSTVQDEGGALTARSNLNFTGGAVSCADNGGSTRTDCTIGFTSTDGAGATNSASGLETGTNGFGLLQGCADGQTLKWDDTNSLWQCGSDRATTQVKKLLDESLTSNTTLQTDDELKFPIGANETFVFEFDVNSTFFNTGTSAGKIKYSLNVPGGATCNYSSHGMDSTGGSSEVVNGGCGTVGTFGGNDTSYFAQMSGTVTNGATPGFVTLQWAQSGSSSTATVVKAGSSVLAFKVTGADLAEAYYSNDMSVGPGDLVQLDSSLKAGVKKADKPYDAHTMGIITTQPGLVMGDGTVSEGKPVLLALSGRVPVKVSTENGAIEPGDFLTSSSTPGVAMKATEPGYAIAQAMAGFSGEGTGTVMAFIKTGWYEPPNVTGADLQNSTVGGGTIDSLRIEGPLTVTNDAVFQGKISVKDIEITGHVAVGKDTAGTAVIPAGQTYVDVTFESSYVAVPKVTATATGFVLVEVTNKTEEGFRINIPEAKAQDTSIDWISLQLKE